MNIYLDIDGVLLANEDNLAIGAVDFIKYAVEHFDVYWLTTHCMHGDAAHAVDYVQQASTKDIRPWLEQFKPTTWSLCKTEAIDFDQDFLWFDDDCFYGEKRDLIAKNALKNWVEVSLKNTPEQLTHELELLKSIVENSSES